MKTKPLWGMIFLLVVATKIFCQDFYDIDTINTIELTFAESNWDELLDNLYAEGNEDRLLGTAIVNGIQYDSVGVRYKGNSSYNSSLIKNPLNIKLDYLIDDQEHQGYGTLKLANVYKDPSFVRETLSYEIARKYMPASQANYCKVWINGTYLGLYTNVQDVDKHFMRTHFYSDDNAYFKGELTNNNMQQETVVWGYWGADSSSYTPFFEIESDYGWKDLIDFLDVLNNNTNDIENYLNIDRHLWMLAFDILMVNLDSPVNFGHNYYLYKDDAGLFNPVIWDLNENFGVFTNLFGSNVSSITGIQQLDPFLNVENDNYPIISKILSEPAYQKIYIAHMKTIMDDVFSNGWYKTRAQELQSIIDTEVMNDPNKFYTYTDFKNNIDNSIGGGGPPGPGNQPIIGITELMQARLDFLNAQPEFLADPPVVHDISVNPSQVSAHSAVTITAGVDNADVVQMVYRYGATDAFVQARMYDDGNHDDGDAGDGIYGIAVNAGATGFQYYIYAENENAASFLPARAQYELFEINVQGDVVINEFMASNESTVTDANGEFDDWIELYNNTDETIQLGGYFLTDDNNDLTQWSFPDTVIAAHNYLIIWADKDDDQTGLHANFKLSASGEAIYLSNSDTSIVDQVTFSEQTDDRTTGRFPDGTGAFVQMEPTFAAANQGTSTDIKNEDKIPSQYILEQNYPNPFNPETNIRFYLPDQGRASVVIFNASGQQVTVIADEILSAGWYEYSWQANEFASGLYFYTFIVNGERIETKKMLLLK